VLLFPWNNLYEFGNYIFFSKIINKREEADLLIAIISDIHSNLEALQKTGELIKERKVDKIVCLGDIVGYGANPKECIKTVSELTPHILMGNHDQAAVDLRYTEKFTSYARSAAIWTNNTMSDSEKDKLLSLPLYLEIDGLTFVHASPHKPSEWDYIATEEEAFNNFRHMKTNICFIGHSHIAEIYTDDYDSFNIPKFSEPIKLSRGSKYIINPGSVGQPRDLDWRLSFGVLNTETLEFEFMRSEYDVKTASRKILDAKLPRYLAERILTGK
jgi:predicted phosphodiesterase